MVTETRVGLQRRFPVFAEGEQQECEGGIVQEKNSRGFETTLKDWWFEFFRFPGNTLAHSYTYLLTCSYLYVILFFFSSLEIPRHAMTDKSM